MTSYYLSGLPDTQQIKASSGAITVTGNINNAMTDDTTTNSTMYPVWVTASTGNLPIKASSTKLTFNPSTGLLTSSALATSSLQLTTNQINQVSSNSDTGQIAINYNGYQGAQTKFRDCVIYNGKGASVVSVTGSTKAVSFAGSVTMANGQSIKTSTTPSDVVVFASVYKSGTAEYVNFITGTAGTDSCTLELNPGAGVLNIVGTTVGSDSITIAGNQINETATDSDSGSVDINYNGYQSLQTKFRNLNVYDGKAASVISVTGSTKAVSFAGVITCINSGIKITGSSSGKTTLASANTGSSDYTLTLPAVTDTIAGITLQQNSNSAAYTTVLSDAGKSIIHPASDNNPRTFTIDSNANVAYPVGTLITFINLINTLTIAIASDTMYLAGTSTTGSRTLAVNGTATALKVSSTVWLISGSGLT